MSNFGPLQISVLEPCNISSLEKEVFADGLLQVKPSSFYESISSNEMRYLCFVHGIYNLPTVELVEWLHEKIGGRKAIEIGAGHGALGRALGIPITDSRLQDDPGVQAYYQMIGGQPTVKYPSDITKLDALSAVEHFSPEIVIGAWCTHLYREDEPWRHGNMRGVNEDLLLEKVHTYIHIGNTTIHDKKRILNKPHQTFREPKLYGRASLPENNLIWVWEKSC